MIFDTEKMTPEERATYEDFAKRFGTEDAPAATPPTPTVEQNEPDDVYKGLHPAVKAELENLRKFREEIENNQYLEIAKRYTILGNKPEELAKSLRTLKDAGGTAYDDMIAMLDKNRELIENSGVFGEIGKRGSAASGAENAWGKIEVAAQEIMKAKPDMRREAAIDAACSAHPELVQEYEKSRS